MLTNSQRSKTTCIHEAGHAVVGHALGWKVARVRAHQVQFEPVTALLPFLATSKRERARRVAALRRAMSVLTAGHVAATLHQGSPRCPQEGADTSRPASSAENPQMTWEARTSLKFRAGCADPDPASDDYLAVRQAEHVEFTLRLQREGRCRRGTPAEWLKLLRAEATFEKEKVLSQLLDAERQAERLLRRHWEAVCELAGALHRSEVGELTRGQVLGLMGPHIERG
jgi:hypothetical protein